ncbi:MAG: hypothetical protein NTY75_04685, partial [Candidatus Shapirobacteria bacterium]|nr:hypothetical protein [Candidatus Shapirobacteria bacterium]
QKYKFHHHNLNILDWANIQNRKFNRLLPNFLFHLNPRYLKTFLKSSAKANYLSQSSILIREILNQKFNLSS